MFSTISVGFSLQSSRNISASGMISYWPRIDIIVDASKVIGINNLSIGFQLDHLSWYGFSLGSTAQERQQLARNANFRLIRVFDFRNTTPRLMPCIYFNETNPEASVWDWSYVDALVDAIFSVGAEPLFCLGWASPDMEKFIPTGMAINPATGLPYPQSYAAYAVEWVRHFKQTGKPVRFYEIMNEPFDYFGWNPSDTTLLGYYVELWNTVARAMRAENPNVMLSQDAITQKNVFNYWLKYGDDVDFLDFHKYDTSKIGECGDAELFRRAEVYRFETTTSTYGVDYVRQKWMEQRGKILPVVNSESNLNSAWETGTDPKIQQMAGAVWTALVLRMGVLKGLSYNVYFEFLSSASYGKTTQTGGAGFGMINSDNNKPWYPYYVHYMIGRNLNVGDLIVETASSSEDVRCLAWVNEQTLNVLLICKVDQPRIIYVQGLQGQLNISRIDNTVSWENAAIQSQVINSGEPIIFNGYTVALIQARLNV